MERTWLSGLLEQTDRLVLAIGGYESSEGVRRICIFATFKVHIERTLYSTDSTTLNCITVPVSGVVLLCTLLFVLVQTAR